MAVITEVQQVQFKLSDVRCGDVFAFVGAVGCRNRGAVLVVTKVAATRDGYNEYASCGGGSYGSTEWLEREINADTLVYKGTVDNLFA